MTRFVVDAGVVIHLARERVDVAGGHELLAPTLLRSQVLSTLHDAVHRGDITPAAGRDLLAGTGRIKIRYLGDAVLRRRAWDIAEERGWSSTYEAEYIALTQLQADALVTMDGEFAGRVGDTVAVASVDALQSAGGRQPG